MARNCLAVFGSAMLVFVLSGVASAGELKVQADADSAGGGLAVNTAGMAVVPILVTKDGVPVTDLASPYATSILERIRISEAKAPGQSDCLPPRFVRAGTQLAKIGIYTLYIAPPVACQTTTVPTPTPAWNKGTYALGIKVNKTTWSVATNTYLRDDGSTLATLLVQ